MKQLALALYAYQDKQGRLPPAVVYGADGKPLYSWRVLVLPFIGEEELYEQFKRDESWDSPHNIRLLGRMSGTFAPPRWEQSRVPPGHTVCHVFIGPGTPFEEGRKVRLPADFPDGTSNTVLVVEAGPPVPWTKPEDLAYHPDRPLPNLTPLFRDGFRAGMADGHLLWVRREASEADLRAAITRNGGETFGPDW